MINTAEENLKNKLVNAFEEYEKALFRKRVREGIKIAEESKKGAL